MAILLAALSAFLYGSADFAGGLATRSNSVRAVLVVSQLAGTLVALLAAPLIGPNNPTLTDLLWGAVAGIGGAVGLVSLYRGIASTLVAVVSPSAALIGAVVPVIFGLVSGDRPSLHAWIGIALCLPAVLLLTATGTRAAHERATVRRAMLFGLLAGVGFGSFFIAISRPSPAAGLWPLIAARSVSVGLVALTAFAAGRSLKVGRRTLLTVLAAGVLDMSANVAFVIATRGSLLSLVTIVTSLFPAPTVLLAWIFFREKVPLFRLVGLVMAIAGVALIGLG